jgi:hypothetical protein
MILTQSQKHWRAWVSALQTRDDKLRAVALEQLTKFLTYWTAELYSNPPIRGLVNGCDTPQSESWDEVFNVDTELLIHPKKTQVHFEQDEAWVGALLCRVDCSLGHMDWTRRPLPNTILRNSQQ